MTEGAPGGASRQAAWLESVLDWNSKEEDMSLQNRFRKFDELIKLKHYDENAELREKRERVIRRLREGMAKQFPSTHTLFPVILILLLHSLLTDRFRKASFCYRRTA